jgi:hypothetical protein
MKQSTDAFGAQGRDPARPNLANAGSAFSCSLGTGKKVAPAQFAPENF